MTRRHRLLAAGALTAATALTGAVATAGPAAAAAQPMGRCSTTTGVVLAVDLSHWGGPLLRSCGTTPTTGYALLNQGGWHTAGTRHDGPAFICRIGYSGYRGGTQYPTPAQEPCVLTPPASAYWSYWHADPGQHTWSYSRLGSMSYHPRPGSVDLWTFGATDTAGTEGRPAISPDAVRARNTAPQAPATHAPPATHRPPAAPHPGTGAPATATPPGPPASASRSGSATPSDPASASAPATTASPSATGAPAAAPDPSPSTPILDAAPTDAVRAGGHGSGTPTLIAVAAAVVLGAAAAAAAWRRRRAA